MKLHPIHPGVPCPHCLRAQLSYLRPHLTGDVYHCDSGAGGCGRFSIHRREKGKPACGIAPILSWGMVGKWEKCAAQYD